MDDPQFQPAEDLLRIGTLSLAEILDPPDEETAALIERATQRLLDNLGDGPDPIICQ